MWSSWSSCLSITCTCSKILLMFHTLTERSIDDVIAQFQFPIVNASNWMIRPKWASSTLTNCRVRKHHTYKFFLHNQMKNHLNRVLLIEKNLHYPIRALWITYFGKYELFERKIAKIFVVWQLGECPLCKVQFQLRFFFWGIYFWKNGGKKHTFLVRTCHV